MAWTLLAVALLLSGPSGVGAQSGEGAWAEDPPGLQALVDFDRGESDLRLAVVRYDQDRRALLRRYDVPYSATRRARLRTFYDEWLRRLAALDFDGLNHEGRVDYALLRNEIGFELEMLAEEEREVAEMAPLVPFAETITSLQEARRDRLPIDAREAAVTLDELADRVAALQAALADTPSASVDSIKGVVAERAASYVGQLRRTLTGWNRYFDEYDPLFTWWATEPYERLDGALGSYQTAIRSRFHTEDGPVVGDPVGDEGLRAHLAHEMIPYTAEELIRIAEGEFAWMEEALVAASREMGYGDDWRAAQEAVKNLAVDPGEKPALVLEIARHSVDFVKERDWVTIPPQVEEIWRMEMMSPESQLVSPFFLGGEVIQISYPTDDMEHDDKLMSMRGNNPHFNYGTVQHELIPGHHLQGWMSARFNEHRSLFTTPFFVEGWALYWEMRLWENDFARGPEDRIGMLFWRMHRAARIIFSLRFHLGTMTPEEAVDFLVDRVGHERANAEAEVRRSFNGSYPPLYQAAYMLGGMQLRQLHSDLVESGQMTERAFHDAVLQGGTMPIEMVRARITGQPLERDHSAEWRFAGEVR